MTEASLVFYTNPWSRAAIARWMLEEVGAPYRDVVLQYGEEMASSAYHKTNPMNKVPTIEHKGTVISETAAICLYLADAFPDIGLAPALSDRAAYYRWFCFAAGPLEHAVTNKSLGWEPSTLAEQRRLGYGTFDRAVGAIESWLDQHTYICGDRFTAADVYVGAQITWGLQFGTLPKRPLFESYSSRVTDREAYARAKALDEQVGATLKGPA